jgi:membrane protein
VPKAATIRIRSPGAVCERVSSLLETAETSPRQLVKQNDMTTITATQAKDLLVKSWSEFNKDQAPRLGAALAYYTVLSLAPLLILLIALAALLFGKEAATGQLVSQIQGMVGKEGAEAIQQMIAGASKPTSGIVASIIGFLTLLFGASSVAGELKAALNIIWDRPPESGDGVVGMVTQRSKALGVVLAGGFLLLVSLTVSSLVAAAGAFFTDILPIPEFIMHAALFVLSLLVIAAVFAVLFKYLPDVNVQWHDVFIGAIFTSFLFTIGKFAIGMYLGKASLGSTYGAAGSLVIVLVWVYYSAQIFFFGAEFTQVYAEEYGSDPAKTRNKAKNATPIPGPAAEKRPRRPYAEIVGEQATGVSKGASSTVGTILGSALAITKLVRIFRRSR